VQAVATPVLVVRLIDLTVMIAMMSLEMPLGVTSIIVSNYGTVTIFNYEII